MWKFWLLILTVTVSGCQSPQFKEAVIDSQIIEAQTPSKSWRVKPGSVYDGDTFWAIADVTNEEVKIRMACIDAPEMKQAGGKESRDFLRSMLPDNAEVVLMISDTDQYGRSVAEVFAPVPNSQEEIAVNGEMIVAGMAHYYKRYNKACPDNAERYGALEQQAITAKIGVWKNGIAQTPWDYRKQNK